MMQRNPDIVSARIFEGTEDQIALRFAADATPGQLRDIAAGIIAEANRVESIGKDKK